MPDTHQNSLRGVWPPVLIESSPDGSVDLTAVTRVVNHFAAAGVHGIYTADTASEFYALEYDEWDELAVHFRRAAREAGLPAGIGCTWTNQAGSIRRIARANELGYDNIHLSQPYWVRLNAPAQEAFWKAVAEHAGSLKVIVYAGSQGQFPLDGTVVRKLREYCPSISGTKTPGFDAVATNNLLVECPDLAHFVHEQVLCLWMGMGASGCFSNLAGMCPHLALKWFSLMEAGEWGPAFDIQRRVSRFYEEGCVPVRRQGFFLDKAMAEIGGVPGITRRQRPPYMPVPDEWFQNMKEAARRHLPECDV